MKQFIAILGTIFFFISCDDKNKYDINIDNHYQKSKSVLEETERKHPANFLTAVARKRKNFIRQTVVIGNVYNSARIVAYRDIELIISFYSKTGTKLEENHHTVYEQIAPGGTVSFKSKYFPPKDTDSLAVKVIAAKF